MAKWLTVVTVVIAVLWSGWWLFGSQAVERGILGGVQSARTEGWRIEYDEVSISGFPSRFDTTVTGPQVTTPDGALRWTAPFAQVFALAYRPNHLIAVAPNEMTLEVPGNVIDVTNADLRGSVVVTASAQPVLDRSTVTAQALRIAVADLWVEVGAGQFASRQAGNETVHDAALTLSDIDLAPALRAIVDPGERFPGQIDSLAVEAEVGLSGAIGAAGQSLIESVTLHRGELLWGETRANLRGKLTIDTTGRPEGTLTLSLNGWEPLVAAAVAQGALSLGQSAILSAGIGGLSDVDGTAQVPVTIANGQVSVLGLPIAVLPGL